MVKRIYGRQALELPDRWQWGLAAFVSQIGCVALPKEILSKVEAGQTLTDEERRLHESHPEVAGKLLAAIPRLEDVAEIVTALFLKTCNPTDLIFTVQQALAHKRLEEQSRRLLREYQRQASTLARVEHNSPGLLLLDTDEEGAVVVDESDGECDVKDLLEQIERAMTAR